jgi:hypothetical protein
MKFTEILEEEKYSGYEGMSTRLFNDTGKKISPKKIKKYLNKIDKTKEIKDLNKRAEKIGNSDAYKYAVIYRIVKGHFS